MTDKNAWNARVACNLVLDDKAGGGYALRVTGYTLEEIYQAFKQRYDNEKEIAELNQKILKDMHDQAAGEPEGS